MYHLDNTSGVPEMPEPKEEQSMSPRWFGESQEQGGISWPGADWFNIIQAELLNILKLAGVDPKKNDYAQLATAIQQLASALESKLVKPDGFKNVGKCSDISELVTIDPDFDGQSILVAKYDKNMPHTCGGGEFFADFSLNDGNINPAQLWVYLFRSPSGYYWRRSYTGPTTPYHGGAWGTYDFVTMTGPDDTAAWRRAAAAAHAVPHFISGDNIVGDKGRFTAWAQGAPNKFNLKGTIEFDPILVDVDMRGASVNFREAERGTSAADPNYCFLFNNKTQASYHAISFFYLPQKTLGIYDQNNHSYQVLIGFVQGAGITTGCKVKIIGGALQGGWRGVMTSQDHFYYFVLEDVYFMHFSSFCFYGYVESDSGEENIIKNCKLTASENLAFLGNGIWNLQNTSLVYPYNGHNLVSPSGFINLDTCFFETYQDAPGYMIYQKGGNYPSFIYHQNTHFAKIRRNGLPIANPQPFYTGLGATCEGYGASFDKVWQINAADDTTRLNAALHAGAGGNNFLRGTKVPTVSSDENNARFSFPPAMVPVGNVSKLGAVDNAWLTSSNTDITQSGSYFSVCVFGQVGVTGAPDTLQSDHKRSWIEGGNEVAQLIKTSGGLTFSVATSATPAQTYNAIIGVMPVDKMDTFLPQVTYSADADFALTLWFVMTTQQFSNSQALKPKALRISSQGVAVTLPSSAVQNTLPNIGPHAPGVLYGGLKNMAASHVMMCVSSKSLGSTIYIKNASLVKI